MSSQETPAAPVSRRRLLAGAGTAALLGAAGAGVLMDAPTAGAAPPPPESNSAHFVDVTKVDGRYVVKPLVRSETYDPSVARENSKRIRAILVGPSIGPRVVIYFPAGVYFFDGADGDWDSTIQSTQPFMTFRGAGINGTMLRQKSLTANAVIKLSHDNCSVEDLMIASADHSSALESSWAANPHQSAIHLKAPENNWYTDPRIERVSINSNGNTIVFNSNGQGFYRPFQTAIRVDGPWLNIYTHEAWVCDVKDCIRVYQGGIGAGPAKFIDVNFYATKVPDNADPNLWWTRFFVSEVSPMEQVELLDCTFIGSQFVYIDGRPQTPGGFYAPVYNMVIDHCYVNPGWLTPPSQDYKYCGLYFYFPPDPNGNNNYTRDIEFRNNHCSTIGRPAFFYLDGVVRSVIIDGNDISSGIVDKCVYIRANQGQSGGDVAVRDLQITNNVFWNYRNVITVGGDKLDPQQKGPDDDKLFTDRVKIAGNITQNEPGVLRIGLTDCFLNRCRQVTVIDNQFHDTALTSIALANCVGAAVMGNNVRGLTAKDGGNDGYGILVTDCVETVVSDNTLFGFRDPLQIVGGSNVAVVGNTASGGLSTGVVAKNAQDILLSANIIVDSKVGLTASNIKGGVLNGNRVSRGTKGSQLENLESVTIVGNCFDVDQPALGGTNTRVLVRSNLGLADS